LIFKNAKKENFIIIIIILNFFLLLCHWLVVFRLFTIHQKAHPVYSWFLALPLQVKILYIFKSSQGEACQV